MKKQNVKKLALTKESLLTLAEPVLEEVNGGARPSHTIIRTCTC